MQHIRRLPLLVYLVAVAVGLACNAIQAAAPNMIWLSPKNVSNNVAEDFSAARGVWSQISVGAGSRYSSPVFHVDSKGSIWIFGGQSQGDMKALWNYDPIKDQYRWVTKADTTVDEDNPSVRGQKGVPGDDVFPGYNTFSAHAIDYNDNIWIYGSEEANENTMWMYNTTSLQFTWVGGDESNLAPTFGALGAASAEYWPGHLEGACMVVDSKNNLWLLGGYVSGPNLARSGVWQYDTKTRMWSLQHGDPNSTDQSPDYKNKYWPGRWMASCTIDEEDRVWLFGGYAETAPNVWNDMWSFDTKTVTWQVERAFNDSDVLGNVVSYDTYDMANFPAARDRGGMVDRRDGTIMMHGGFNFNFLPAFHDTWVYNKSTKLWKIVFGSGNNATIVDSIYNDYREPGSQLGTRREYGIEKGLTSKGHLYILGGDNSGDVETEIVYNDLWILPQEDQCMPNLRNCDPNASCVMKTTWTYECTCKQGYTGDGRTCTAPQAPSTAQPGAQPGATQSSATKALILLDSMTLVAVTFFASIML